MVPDTHPTRLKDIKALLEDYCDITWLPDTIRITMPRHVWKQITPEEVMLIVLGREIDTTLQTTVDSDKRITTLEIANRGRANHISRSS